MGKPFRNFREGFFDFDPKIRIFRKSISLKDLNRFLDFLHFLNQNRTLFKPVFKFLT
jgi:hypothetical protein